VGVRVVGWVSGCVGASKGVVPASWHACVYGRGFGVFEGHVNDSFGKTSHLQLTGSEMLSQISRTNRAKGRLLMSSSAPFWYLRIS